MEIGRVCTSGNTQKFSSWTRLSVVRIVPYKAYVLFSFVVHRFHDFSVFFFMFSFQYNIVNVTRYVLGFACEFQTSVNRGAVKTQVSSRIIDGPLHSSDHITQLSNRTRRIDGSIRPAWRLHDGPAWRRRRRRPTVPRETRVRLRNTRPAAPAV